MNPQIFTALVTFTVGAMATFLTYKNYQLNKTLNIKNHLFNEKLTLYREISKNLGELIVELDEMEKDFNKADPETLEKHASWIEEKCKLINALILEGSVLLPKLALLHLIKLTNFLFTPPNVYREGEELQQYKEIVDELRFEAEKVLKFFRKDLGIKSLSDKKLQS